MKPDMKLIEGLKKQIEVELSIVEDLKSTSKKTKNDFVKSLLEGLSLESMKHALLLEAMIELQWGRVVLDEDKAAITKALRDHLELENGMFENFKELIRTTTDPRIKVGLEDMANDEIRHHKAIEKMIDVLLTASSIDEYFEPVKYFSGGSWKESRWTF